MALKDIIGQENAIKILQGCIAKNRIPHALFFAGDEGIGKRLTAINFAKTLNCKNTEHRTQNTDNNNLPLGFEALRSEDSLGSGLCALGSDVIDSCDQCPSCTKIDKGNHPDVFVIGPEGDGGQIKVSVIRELEEALSYKPFEGTYKIAVIDNAEKMNQEASNAFLSTLEAPPSQSILVLISSRPDMLLGTIRSRCQRINFTPLPIDAMTNLLQENFKKLNHEQTLLISTLSGGRAGYALNEELITQRDMSFNILKLMLNRFEEELRDDSVSMEELFDWAQLWLRDMSVYKATGRADLLINRDLESDIKAIACDATLKDILKLARELYNIKINLNFNLNEKLTLNYTSLLMRKRLGKPEQINARRQ
ncbi:MAG: DNA polymerase III subunit delta' [Nitrospirae bacterium]|nr:DNA polymerase III subunit delta' [Nitrospirota bacterium]